MSDEESRSLRQPKPPETDEPDDAAIRELLQRALGAPNEPPVDVLGLVQKRLRERSRGKFYGEGWSTSGEPPVAKYLVTSLLMLGIAVAAYCILGLVFDAKSGVEPLAPSSTVPH